MLLGKCDANTVIVDGDFVVQVACRMLNWAVRGNNGEAVAGLVKMGADPNRALLCMHNYGVEAYTALYYAVVDGNASMVRLLLELGADPKAACVDRDPCDLGPRAPLELDQSHKSIEIEALLQAACGTTDGEHTKRLLPDKDPEMRVPRRNLCAKKSSNGKDKDRQQALKLSASPCTTTIPSQRVKAACEAELAEAINAAVKALDSIKKADIDQIIHMIKPPTGVMLALHGVLIMLERKCIKRKDPNDPTRTLDDLWTPARELLCKGVGGKPLIEVLKAYNKDDIPQRVTEVIRSKFATGGRLHGGKDTFYPYASADYDLRFDPAAIARSSSAAAKLCQWVLAMERYDRVAKLAEIEVDKAGAGETNAVAEVEEAAASNKVAECKEMKKSAEHTNHFVAREGEAEPSQEEQQETTTMWIGQRVLVNGKACTIAFLGDDLKRVVGVPAGRWVGVVYDEPVGKNDGTVKGVRLFKCKKNHGHLVRPDKVALAPAVPSSPKQHGDGAGMGSIRELGGVRPARFQQAWP